MNTDTHSACCRLQQALQQRYDLTLSQSVDDYVCHDRKLVREFTNSDTDLPELLLFREDEDTLDVTLYLDEAVLAAVDQPGLEPGLARDRAMLENFLTVAEGVSHFVYLIWNAEHGRQFRLVEMELQAEIDKFILVVANQAVHASRPHDPQQLARSLFDDVDYIDDDTGGPVERYRTANHFARRYCQWLSREQQLIADPDGLDRELARFYRLAGPRKFDYIKAL